MCYEAALNPYLKIAWLTYSRCRGQFLRSTGTAVCPTLCLCLESALSVKLRGTEEGCMLNLEGISINDQTCKNHY